MSISIERLDSCASTNAELAARPDAPHGFVVATREQTAGRGQRGNHWESQPGQNLTFSICLRPAGLAADRQFELSMLVSLAVTDVLGDLFLQMGHPELSATIKWPNDIYVGHRKIAGILIENTISSGMIERSIVGIGLNVNQTEFTPYAPNPVSIAQLTGVQIPLDAILGPLCETIVAYVDQYMANQQPAALKITYRQGLYLGQGQVAQFVEPDGEPFGAAILDVGLDGRLYLTNGRDYAFKEVAYVLADA